MSILNREMETISRKDLEDLQLERLQITINRAYHNVDFYRKRFDEAGVTPDDIRKLEDLRKLPFTTKEDLKNNYPYGLFAVPLRDVVRLKFPLGLAGNPIVIGYTRKDLEVWRELMARVMTAVGITEQDIIQIAFNYSLFPGAFSFNEAAEFIGAMVAPTSIASAAIQIQIMQDFKSTVLASTPSFARHIIDTLHRKGRERRSLSLKKGLLGAEPWSEEFRRGLEEDLGIDAYDIYGIRELIEPGVSGECEAKNGLHIFEDHFLPEIVHSQTGESLPYGKEGELVVTTLTIEGYPLIRYRTRDLTSLNPESCSCGRSVARMSRVFKRVDDLFTVRGINIFPEQIERILSTIPGIGKQYRLVVRKKGEMNDRLEIQVALSEEFLKLEEHNLINLVDEIKGEVRRAIGLRTEVKLVESARLKDLIEIEGKVIFSKGE